MIIDNNNNYLTRYYVQSWSFAYSPLALVMVYIDCGAVTLSNYLDCGSVNFGPLDCGAVEVSNYLECGEYELD